MRVPCQHARTSFASIVGSLQEPLNPVLSPVPDAATSGGDFRLDDVRRKRMTISAGIERIKLAESRFIMTPPFSQLRCARLTTAETDL